MYNNIPIAYHYPFYGNTPRYACPCSANMQMCTPELWQQQYVPYFEQSNPSTPIKFKDYGPDPFVINIEEATDKNDGYGLEEIHIHGGCLLNIVIESIA